MSEPTTIPEASAESQAPVSGAVPPAGSAPAALSSALLSERIKAQLTGASPAITPPAPSPEPSLGASGTPPSQTIPPPSPAPTDPPSDSDDDSDDEPAGLPPRALAALSQARKAKREAKARAKTLEQENAELRAELAGKPGKPADHDAATAATAVPTTTELRIPELVQAEKVVGEQEGLRNWARTQTSVLRRAIDAGDVDAVISRLQSQVKDHNVTLPTDPEGVMEWIDGVRTTAEDRLEEARLDVRFIRQRAQTQGAAMRTESQALASEWAPKMTDATSEQGKRASMIRNYFPALEQHPLGPRFIAAAVRGWEVITAELSAKPGQAGAASPAMAAALPPKPGAKLPGAPAVVPARPDEGAESSGSLAAKMRAATSETERERLKTEWVKAALAGR